MEPSCHIFLTLLSSERGAAFSHMETMPVLQDRPSRQRTNAGCSPHPR